MGQGERIQTLHYEPRRMYSNSGLWAKENVFKLLIVGQDERIQTPMVGQEKPIQTLIMSQ